MMLFKPGNFASQTYTSSIFILTDQIKEGTENENLKKMKSKRICILKDQVPAVFTF
jgi:hypothetical protein